MQLIVAAKSLLAAPHFLKFILQGIFIPTTENTQPIPLFFPIKMDFLNFLSMPSLQTRCYQQLLFFLFFFFCFIFNLLHHSVYYGFWFLFSVSRLYLFEEKKNVCCLKKPNNCIAKNSCNYL